MNTIISFGIAAIGFIFLFPISVFAISFDTVANTTPTGFVSDFAKMIKDPEAIEKKLQEIEQETSAEIAVVTIDKLPPDHTIETFAVELFEKWGIGKKENDNGLLLLIAKQDRKFRIETGYGLEGTIPDAFAMQITQSYLVPAFKRGDYDAGISHSIDVIKDLLVGDIDEVMATSSNTQESMPPWLFFLMILWSIMSNILKHPLIWVGLIGGSLASFLLGGPLGLILFFFVFIFISILFSPNTGGGSNGSGSSGFSGGGFSGGSSFGGFSGGISGGGGFSGSW